MVQGSMRMVPYEGQTIRYVLGVKQVKNLNLRIRKDGSVYVSADPSVPHEKVDAFVQSKGAYILSAQKKFRTIAEYAPKPKQYISGENFCLLGRGLRLKVEPSAKEEVFSDGVYLYLRVKDPDDLQRKQKIVVKYFEKLCRETFGEVISALYPIFQKYGVEMPKLRIRDMETRWGSCLAKKGIITLNKRLLEAPRNCIEYVVMHEFCHFIHPDHSKRFYAFLTMLMPDWKERKSALEQCAIYGL